MARLRDPEKRTALLDAAVQEIAVSGLGAPTSKIAKRANVAEGTLFTYFPTKEDLLNELYLDIKLEIYDRVNSAFPAKSSLQIRTHYLWDTFMRWALEFPEKRKVSRQLYVSTVITKESQDKTAAQRGAVETTLKELDARAPLADLPSGFAAATLSAMQEATLDFIARHPRRREELMQRGFDLYWRAVK